MLKAIQDAGIPVDMVGGVSIGAFMGALYCCERNTTTVTQKAREWSKKMTQWHRQILDLTYPITSMFTGKGFNQTIVDTFGDVYIEDLWIPYFTLTTDITASCSRIHTNGKRVCIRLSMFWAQRVFAFLMHFGPFSMLCSNKTNFRSFEHSLEYILHTLTHDPHTQKFKITSNRNVRSNRFI